MRILQVSNGYPPKSIGGVEIYTQALSQTLQRKHEVTVFTREWDYQNSNYELRSFTDEKIIVKSVTNNIAFPEDFSKSYKNSIVDKIFLDLVKNIKPDIIHFHHLIGLSGNLPLMTKKLGIPYVMSIHDFWYICPCGRLLTLEKELCKGINPDCVIDYFKLHPPGMTKLYSKSPDILKKIIPLKIKRRFQEYFISSLGIKQSKVSKIKAKEMIRKRSFFFKEILCGANLVITPSLFVKNKYKEFGIPEKNLLHLSVGIELKGLKKQQRQKSPKEIRFAYLGSLYEFKGIHILIEAFKKIISSNSVSKETSLSIYGDPSIDPIYSDTLEKISSLPNIVFKGKYEQKNLYKILDSIDIVVVPSLVQECYPTVALEAQASKTPVIASKIGSLAEIVSDGVNGFLFKPNDVEDLSKKMKQFISNPHLINQFSQKAKKSIDIKTNTIEIEKIYKRILRNFL